MKIWWLSIEIPLNIKSNILDTFYTISHCIIGIVIMMCSMIKNYWITLKLDKFHVITFSISHSPTISTYYIDNSPLVRVSEIKDLDIHFISSLSFGHHIDLTVARALKVLGFIQRNTKYFTSLNCLRSLYFSLVRSILEFGVPVVVWHPYLAEDQ